MGREFESPPCYQPMVNGLGESEVAVPEKVPPLSVHSRVVWARPPVQSRPVGMLVRTAMALEIRGVLVDIGGRVD